jgi:hypothetical protein
MGQGERVGLRLICDRCGLRPAPELVHGSVCPECAGPVREMARLESLVDRWVAPPPQVASAMHRRHLQLVELIWTADGRGREFYEVLHPKGISYDRFVDRVTQVVCKGLAEGWIEIDLPPAPVPDDRAYQIQFRDPDRFAGEVLASFAPRQPLAERRT